VKKLLIVFLLFMVCTAPLFCAKNLSAQEQKAIDDMMMFRLDTYLLTPEKTVKAVKEYKQTFLEEASKNHYSDETILIVENYLVLEEFGSLEEINPDHPEMKPLLKAQSEKNEQWFKKHEKEEKNSWLYCSYAGIISSYLRYQNFFIKIDKGLLVKEYLEKALEQTPNMSLAQMGLALWYYFAPAISGGSVNKSITYYEKAVSNARNDAELFTAKYYQSQCYFHKDKKNEYNDAMNVLKSLLPENRKVTLLEKLNKAGYTIFDYQENREKIYKKLGI
jgi:hypothetical protein